MDVVAFVLNVLNSHPEKYVVNKFIVDELMKSKETKAEIRSEARSFRNWGTEKYQKAKEAKLRKFRHIFQSMMTSLRRRKCIETINIKNAPSLFIKNMVLTSPGMTVHEVVAHKITAMGKLVLKNPSATNWKRRPRTCANAFSIGRMR